MIDYKQEDNFKMRFFIDIALYDQNEKLDENEEYDENDDNEDLFFIMIFMNRCKHMVKK